MTASEEFNPEPDEELGPASRALLIWEADPDNYNASNIRVILDRLNHKAPDVVERERPKGATINNRKARRTIDL